MEEEESSIGRGEEEEEFPSRPSCLLVFDLNFWEESL